MAFARFDGKFHLIIWQLSLLLLSLSAGARDLQSDTTRQVRPTKAGFLRTSLQRGHILRHQPFLQNTNEEGREFRTANALALEYGWTLSGGGKWDGIYRQPGLGIGLQHLHIAHRDELGHPTAVYGFYDGHFFKTKNFELNSRLSAGLAFAPRAFNPQDSTSNDIFSTRLNSFQGLGLGLALRLSDAVYLEPGFLFIHYSNGNTKEPQKGLNVSAWSLSLRTLLHDSPAPANVPVAESYPKHQAITFLSLAPRQIDFIDDGSRFHETYDLYFLMANLHLSYNYAVARRFRLGLGFDFFFDGTNGMKEAAVLGKPQRGAVPFRDKAGFAVFAEGERELYGLTIVGGVGYILAQTRFESSTPQLEQRLGFKYHFSQRIFAGVNIRAYNFRAAKAIEFNVGWRRLWGDAQSSG